MSDWGDNSHLARRVRRTLPEVSIHKQAEPVKLANLKIGDIANGRYRIISILGEGGMGTVYRAEQIYLRKECALKALTTGISSQTALHRFEHEAQAASFLDHPNLIKVQDYGLIDERQPFLVMDLAEGLQLSEIIKQKGHLDIKTTCALFIQVCKGLEYAHSKGVVHRDIKPDNIIVSHVENPEMVSVKIVDFGIAKHNLGEIESSLTKTGELFGTPSYMSPEQCLGQTVDDRSDIYSVGCVLFEALTGVPPFVAGTALATMWKQQNDNPPTLKEASLGKEFPLDLERIMAKMLRKDLRNRYSNIGQVAHDLEAVAQDSPISLGYEAMLEESKAVKQNNPAAKIAWSMVIFTCLIGLGVTVGLGIKTAQKPPNQVQSDVKIDGINQIDHTKLSNYIPDALPPPPFRFSYPVPGSKYKLYDFGKRDLGLIENIEDGGKALVLVDGKVFASDAPRMHDHMLIDKPFTVHASPDLCLNCNYFKAFQPDEISGITFDSASAVINKEDLANLQHLTQLKSFKIRISSNLDENALPIFNRFTQLRDFHLRCSPGQNCDWLAGITRLKELNSLELSRCKNCEKIMEALRESMTLKQLGLDDCSVDKQTLVNIGAIKPLERLGLSHNPIEDADLEALRGLPHLHDMDLSQCPKLTPACAEILKTLPLRTLWITSFGLAGDEKFRKAFPSYVNIDFTEAPRRKLDPKDVDMLLETPTK